MTSADRLARTRALLDRLELDALLLSRGAFKRWLAGFALADPDDPTHGYAGTLLVGRDHAFLLADSRYTTQAAAQAADWELVATTRPLWLEMADLFARTGSHRCGAESRVLSHDAWSRIEEAAPQVELTAVDNELASLRMVKDASELAALTRAAELTDACFIHLLGWMAPGRREVEITWEVERFLREAGAEGLSFPTIALVGPRAALPHGEPGEARVTAGQAVLVDMGARVDGYRADMTRTVFVGSPDDEARRLYQVVHDAQDAAARSVRPGVAGTAVHAVALDVLAAAGVEPFGHGLGHGIGLEVHEPPSLSERDYPGQNGVNLDIGMTFTIEPGIYRPGQIGIRIEDDFVLTADGVRSLTHSPNQLVTI